MCLAYCRMIQSFPILCSNNCALDFESFVATINHTSCIQTRTMIAAELFRITNLHYFNNIYLQLGIWISAERLTFIQFFYFVN